MHAFLKMTLSEWRLLFREPAAVFFTLIFPLLLMSLFGSVFGNEPVAELGGMGSVDLSTPGYIALIIGTTAFMGIPSTLANYRDQGILRRLRATPVPVLTILGAQFFVNLIMSALGTVILITVGRVWFGLQLPMAPLAFVAAFLFCCVSLFAAGMLLASVLPTARVAQAVGTAVFFPMLFLSGAAMPRQFMPDTLRSVAEVLPLTKVVMLLSDLWFGSGWNTGAIVMLGVLLIIAALISLRTFRWE
jgi:ABC-2 type transport system permease protein